MATTDVRRVARLLVRGAGPLAALSLVAACSSSNDGVVASAGSPITTVAPATTIAPAPPTEAPTSAAPTVAPIDGAASLQTALDTLSAGYHFTTTVDVGGAVAVQADGDRVGDGTRLTISGNGATVNYVITPQGTWVQPEDGTWEALETAPANADPIAALRAPTAVTVAGSDGTTTQLTATVPVQALGIPGAADATADVALTLTSGSLTKMTYSSALNGAAATVAAVLGPVADATPVVAPA